jgi:formate/nitrite transporter
LTAHSGPKALTEYILYQSKHKANKAFYILLIQGILAGIYVSIGAVGFFKTAAAVSDPGLGSFLGALVFPVGIIAILLMQAELFTSDCMVMIAVFAGRTRITKIIRILFLILLANLIGTVFIAYLTGASGIFDAKTMELVISKAIHKAELPLPTLFASAIFCNIIVCIGVCLSYSCKDEISKVVVVWLAITVFVLSSTEHVVANAYYFFVAYFNGAELTLAQIFRNLSVAAVGNFIGGGLIVSGANYMLAYRDI